MPEAEPLHSGNEITNAQCPRCGYDLRGVFQARESEAELRGRCSECGLNYDWQDVLDPKRDRPRWCVEYAQSIREILGRSVLTFFMMLLPWKFWRQLKMSHEVKWIKLGLFFVCLVFVSYTYAVLVGNASILFIILTNGMNWYGANSYFEDLAFPILAHPYYSGELMRLLLQTNTALFVISLLAFMTLLPIGFVLLPVSRRKAKVKLVHLLRIAIYGISIVFMPFLVIVFYVGFDIVNQNVLGWILIGNLVLPGSQFFIYWGPYPMIICWWAVATTHYLKMPHGWAVSILLSIVVILSIALLIACLFITGMVPYWVF